MKTICRLIIACIVFCWSAHAGAHDNFSRVWEAGLALIRVHVEDRDGFCLSYGQNYQAKQKDLRSQLSEYEYKEDVVDPIGNNVMSYAVISDDIVLVKAFAEKGASLTKVHDGTLFHLAAAYASPPILDFLLSKGLTPDEKDGHGGTPLMVAAGDNRIDAVKWFIAHGANVNARTNDGGTALLYSTCCKDKKLIRYLIQSGAELTDKAIKACRTIGIDLEKESNLAQQPAQ